MNGATSYLPVHLLVSNDTEETGYIEQHIYAADATREIINLRNFHERLEAVKTRINNTIKDNYITPIYRIDMNEEGKRDEDKAFVLDHTDATAALGQLYTEASKVPQMMCDAIDPLYQKAESIHHRYQLLFNSKAWEEAYKIQRIMGPGATIKEIHDYSYGGGN